MHCFSDQRGLKKRCKGVPRCKVQGFTHDDYRRVFETEQEISVNCRRMQSYLHVMYNIEQVKIALSHADDKRAWITNNLSVPYGYYDIEHMMPPDEEDDDDAMQAIEEICDDIIGDTKRAKLV
jgi:hypothetical protein